MLTSNLRLATWRSTLCDTCAVPCCQTRTPPPQRSHHRRLKRSNKDEVPAGLTDGWDETWQRSRDTHILPLFHTMVFDGHLLLVFPLMANSLAGFMNASLSRPLPLPHVREIMRQVLQALSCKSCSAKARHTPSVNTSLQNRSNLFRRDITTTPGWREVAVCDGLIASSAWNSLQHLLPQSSSHVDGLVCHRAGVCHTDIKPSNVLLVSDAVDIHELGNVRALPYVNPVSCGLR